MSDAPQCPVCATPSPKQIAATPYRECPTCAAWFQWPQPPKVYQAPTEYDLEAMPEGDRQVNRDLAAWLFSGPMQGTAGDTLDVGCKHPVLASALASYGCRASAIDGVEPRPEPGVLCDAQDFEAWQPAPSVIGKFRLITMIHVFEHMERPLEALERLRLLVADDGRVFLRLPDHRVPGIERDLTPHHYSIHPFVHCLTSILEALAQVRDCFVIESTTAAPGYGQRDIVLRPITRAPALAVAMIAKNEAADVARSIDSLGMMADAFALVDTGSTDETRAIVREAAAAQGLYFSEREYTGASEQDESGDWKLWSFAAARNESLSDAEAFGCDWLMWLDADDEIKTPAAIRRAMYWPEYDVFGTWIDGGGQRWIQTRMWKAAPRVRFAGRCHEYPVTDGMATGQIDDGLIFHHAAPHAGQENSNPRNLRIMLREWDETPNPRTAFYLANTYRDAGRNAEAAEWYAKRIDFGPGFRDEYLFAMLARARCLRALQRHREADEQSRAALAIAPDWAEFRMELAFGQYHQRNYPGAIAEAMRVAPGCEIPPTPLWREVGMYRDQPARLISWCHEHLGEMRRALIWADVAAELIGGHDAEWEQRRGRLQAQHDARNAPAPAIVQRLRPRIALHRPGAIGDILMTLNLIPALREANPGHDVHYFCDAKLGAPDALGGVMAAAGVDLVMDCAQAAQWRGQYDRWIDLIGYPLGDGYPEKPMARHLLQYFGAEMGLQVDALPSLTLARPLTLPAGLPAAYATIQLAAGWSAYKEWHQYRWNQVREALWIDHGIETVLINDARGWSLSESIAVFANARIHLGIDSFTNHLTNYFWSDQFGARKVPGVILWGSTQVTAAGYPDNVNISKGLACQPCFRENPAISRMPRDPCRVGSAIYGDGLHACMQQITVAEVVRAAVELWEANQPKGKP
jgi:tetratricopeptide (TPR) repeat protein